MHPFIPFITEELWLKNNLGNKKIPNVFELIKNKKVLNDKETVDVNEVINVIFRIRSFKNELNVSPGSFIDISIENVSRKKQNLFLNNQIILKKLGRINSIFTEDSSNESATLLFQGKYSRFFDKKH